MNTRTAASDQRTYESSLARGVYETVVLLSGVAFLIWLAIGPRGFGSHISSAFIITVAISPLYYLYLYWTAPRRVTLINGVIEVQPWLGPQRPWNLRDLTLREETTWSRLWGVREITDHDGKLLFRVTRGLRGSAELCSRLGASPGGKVKG